MRASHRNEITVAARQWRRGDGVYYQTANMQEIMISAFHDFISILIFLSSETIPPLCTDYFGVEA